MHLKHYCTCQPVSIQRMLRCIRKMQVFRRSGCLSTSHVPVRTRAIVVMGSAEKKMADRADHRTSHAARSHETRDER
jgi:hypothetical protein